VKQPLDALVPEFLASLQEGAGGDKGTVDRQKDIELIDQQTWRKMGMPMMAQTRCSMGMRDGA